MDISESESLVQFQYDYFANVNLPKRFVFVSKGYAATSERGRNPFFEKSRRRTTELRYRFAIEDHLMNLPTKCIAGKQSLSFSNLSGGFRWKRAVSPPADTNHFFESRSFPNSANNWSIRLC